MRYERFDPSDRVNTIAPSMQTVEKLEERRFLLSSLTIVCVLYFFSQLFADYQGVMSFSMLCKWVVNTCLSVL